jgi:hypothetical protein
MKRHIALGCAALAAGTAIGSDTAPVPRVHYTADWYASLMPRTALDMVRQTPGFTIIEGEKRRGLAGALGNVLVDGRRPTAKDQTLEDILGRIPAAQVERIEMLRGAEATSDSSGHAILLNVVRTPFTGQGFGSLGFEYARQPMPNGTLVWSGRAHSVDYAIGANTYTFDREQPGSRQLTDIDGNSTGTRQDVSPRDYGQYALNGEASSELGGGRLRLTGKASYSRYHEDSAVASYDAGAVLTGADFNPYTESKRGGEFGGQFDHSVGDWILSSTLLLTRARFESEITSTHSDAAGTVGSVFEQRQLRDSGESILRATLAREISAARRLEFGLEAALNTLDASLALTLDLGGGAVPIPVPNSNVRIEEQRTDGFVNYGWRPGGVWSLDLRLAGEFSRLEFSGDSNQVVEFAFAKPALQLSRPFGAANQLRLRLARDVGQLDFNDFVSSVSLTDERVEGGNPDLRPQTDWSLELGTDLRPGNDIGLTFNVFYRWVSDTADFTPVGPPDALVDAPGNIGDGRIYGAQAVARVPLQFLRGAALNLDVTWQHSEVTDPLTGEQRSISEFQDVLLNAGFRQDLPRASWGMSYSSKSATSSYLLREIDRQRASPSLDAFVEVPLPHGLRLRAAVVSLLGQEETRDRLFFDPDRRVDEFSAERSQREPGRWYQIGVSGSF